MRVMPETSLHLDNNPVRRARVRLDLSLYAVASAAKVNYQTWYLTECGCYKEIPPVVLAFLEAEGFNVLHLENEYTDYVSETRDDFALRFRPVFEQLELGDEKNSVVEFRETLGLSRAALGKQLCVQPAVLYKVESGHSKGLPQQLREALIEVGIPEDLLEELEKGVTRGQ